MEQAQNMNSLLEDERAAAHVAREKAVKDVENVLDEKKQSELSRRLDPSASVTLSSDWRR